MQEGEIVPLMEGVVLVNTVGDLKKWLEHIPDDRSMDDFIRIDFGKHWNVPVPIHILDEKSDEDCLDISLWYEAWDMPPELHRDFGEFCSAKAAVVDGFGDDYGEDIYGKKLWQWVKHRKIVDEKK